MPIKPVDLKELESKAENIYEAIVLMSKRARQINEENKLEFNQRIELIQTKTETDEEVDANPDQLKISLEFEKRPKPTEISLEETMANKLEFRYKEAEEEPEKTTEEE
ncbi:MAG: DNA-directed RNA polymerase subunit omega [Bacteroidota bacterium]